MKKLLLKLILILFILFTVISCSSDDSFIPKSIYIMNADGWYSYGEIVLPKGSKEKLIAYVTYGDGERVKKMCNGRL